MDNRKYLRLPTGAIVEYKEYTFPLSNKGKKTGRAIDVSGGGLLFLSDKPILPETVIEVKFNLLGWRKKDDRVTFPIEKRWVAPLIVLGTVRRMKKTENENLFEIAVEFLSIDRADQRVLDDFIIEEFKKT